eukprot:CAMPEP_0197541126 /NCGR_PEP_ID=MMETSP1318-20131121/66987_1 /TAXON_ID=552666 /ORGANISM="Partenskyella glossopodia, Strain RCC365" /LENGTH=191 /DNA_ID=CAMNT_0043100267 /DNA_START=833 /DNA_END=1405 /DNA_ORIENTATION=-
MDFKEIQEYYDVFEKMDRNKDGKLDKKEFLQGLKVDKNKEWWGRTFDLLDDDGDGYIDFRVYLIGMAFANKDLDNETVLATVHKIFDKDGDGYINLEEFEAILVNAYSSDELFTKESVKKIFRECDDNGDGKIAVDEFIKYAKKHPELNEGFNMWKNSFSIESMSELASRRISTDDSVHAAAAAAAVSGIW